MADCVDIKPNITGHIKKKHKPKDKKPQVVIPERIQFFNIQAENELCVQVGSNYNVEIELLSGTAEVYGTEMERNKVYLLKAFTSISVFSCSGCQVKVSGTPSGIYFSSESSMLRYINIHDSLELRRQQAETENKKGPVVLVLGSNDFNKNALCHLLLNYAVRIGRHPVFVDIDVGQNTIFMPSTIGVLTVTIPADIANGFKGQPIETYYHGYRSAWENTIPYTLLLQRLNLSLQSYLMQNNQNVKTSGVIIHGCDWSKGEIDHHGYGTVSLAVDIFKVDVVCVIDEERSFVDLKRQLPENIEVFFIPKSSKVDPRSWFDKGDTRYARLRDYFYRPFNNLKQQPHKFEVKFSDIQVFKIVQKKKVDRHTQFLGDVKPSDVDFRKVGISDKLVDQIFALSSAENVEIDMMYKPITGFISVMKVDVEKDIITVISPHPGPLSTKILLAGDTRIGRQRTSCKRKQLNGKNKVKKEKKGNKKMKK